MLLQPQTNGTKHTRDAVAMTVGCAARFACNTELTNVWQVPIVTPACKKRLANMEAASLTLHPAQYTDVFGSITFSSLALP